MKQDVGASLLCSLSPHSSPTPPPPSPLPLHASFQRLFPTPLAHTTPPHLLPPPSLLPLSPTPFPPRIFLTPLHHLFPPCIFLTPLSPPHPFPPRILLTPFPHPPFPPRNFLTPLPVQEDADLRVKPLRFSIPIAIRTSPGEHSAASSVHHTAPIRLSCITSLLSLAPSHHPSPLSPTSVHSPVSSIHPLPSLHPHIDQQALISTLRPVVRVGGLPSTKAQSQHRQQGEDAPHGHDGEGPEGVRPRVKVGQGGERGPRLVQQREDAAHKRHHGRQILQQREQRVGQACWGRGRADLRLVGGKGN
ncbi:unnamed protein product [Closterium sp. NIES-64]|nr:unnamed protein product [Closterium sp. NIES-64]